ncbi:hypothetical protein HGM15179_005239 [Zosterops borbonicus]|uniref:Uncharacterized protein n=1 Tax=Zosterops borbonicus TaxID=364589 RepID=A0A8K1GQV3_9PASS|nr:hypothetical protein HGM15179_005239 [Zosterops borbonicus]
MVGHWKLPSGGTMAPSLKRVQVFGQRSQAHGGIFGAILCQGQELDLMMLPQQVTKDKGQLEKGPAEATKMIQGLERLSDEKRLQELCLFSLEERRLRGDLINPYKDLKDGCQGDAARLYSWCPKAG